MNRPLTAAIAVILISAVSCGCTTDNSAAAGGADNSGKPSVGKFVLSEEDKELYGAMISDRAKELLELNPDTDIGFRITFAELNGDDHAEMIMTMCTEKGNAVDYIFTIEENEVTGVNSWLNPVLDSSLFTDSEGTLYENYVTERDINGADVTVGYLTRYVNSHSAYFDYASVTANDQEAFIAGVDRVMWRAEGYHFIQDDELEKYKDGSGYGFYAFELREALQLDENAYDEIVASDISPDTLVFTRQTYDRLMEKEFEGLTQKHVPALSTDVITSPDGFDFSLLKDITI